MGVLASLKELVLRVEQYLKYQLYHAQNIYPYPEDQNVAEWVREEGEPNGWVRFAQDATTPKTEAKVTPEPKKVQDNDKPKIKSQTI